MKNSTSVKNNFDKYLKNQKNAVHFIQTESTAFKFKSKCIKKGQYRLPFVLKLPQKLPGSFNFENNKESAKKDQDLGIAYFFECFIGGMRFKIFAQKEVKVRQFLFTSEEIQKDLEYQKVIIHFQKMLNPGDNSTLVTLNIDKDRLMKEVTESNLLGEA
jgi:hypothetical protein